MRIDAPSVAVPHAYPALPRMTDLGKVPCPVPIQRVTQPARATAGQKQIWYTREAAALRDRDRCAIGAIASPTYSVVHGVR
jgi:hypothetical protein